MGALGHKDPSQSPWWWAPKETWWHLEGSLQHLLVWEWRVGPPTAAHSLDCTVPCVLGFIHCHVLSLPFWFPSALLIARLGMANPKHFQQRLSPGKRLLVVCLGKRGETVDNFDAKNGLLFQAAMAVIEVSRAKHFKISSCLESCLNQVCSLKGQSF